jgi:putative ABC transport system permease protein
MKLSADEGNAMSTLFQDVRYGFRMLAKNPGFTAVAVVTLALGIGANTTIFSVAWRPMRYRDANRLLMVWETRPDGGRSAVSAPTYLDWRDQNRSFEQLAAAHSTSVALSGNPPTLVSGASVTPNFFDTFRLRPELGRFFSAAEFRPGGDKVAVLSHEVWQTHFGGEADIVGKTIRLDGETHVVVGAAPAEFEFWGQTDVWMPLVLPIGAPDRQTRDLLVVGRLKPGVTPAHAGEEMRTLAARVAQESPETNKQWSALAQNFYEALAGPGVNLMLVLLFATVCVVLVMACVNVANLLLARATTRQKEIAVRIAFGASRWRVVRQLLAETLLLALMGGALGLLLAFAAVRYLATLPVLQAPGLAPIEINRLVLEFAVALCLAATVLSGFVPALRTTATNLMEHVKASGHTTVGDRKQNRLRRSG